MNDLVSNPSHFRKVEFWAATTIFVFAVFFLNTADARHERELFSEARVPFHYYQDFFFPHLIRYTFLYLAFLFLNFKVVPKLIELERLDKRIFYALIFSLIPFVIIGLAFGITDTYAKNYLFTRYKTEDDTYNVIFQDSFFYAFRLLLLFGFYTFIKFTGIYLLSSSEAIQSKYRIITRDGVSAIVLWMISMFLLLVIDADGEIVFGWGIVGPSGILLYCYSFYALIPNSLPKKNPFRAYLGRAILVLIASVIPIAVLAYLLGQDDEFAFTMAIFNVFFQLLITVPLSWLLYKRQMQGNAEIHVLKKELGQSNANFDFLRSQINPHFLFNALNTVYGTAIQEKAERTSEGIERLGEMMRFMLQENLQERISLAREIEYLHNYISFQKLRTDPNPIIRIETQIEQQVSTIQIAPMLLIPFVENAFKHGISFREPSHIHTTLSMKEKTLYFDVHNSKHEKQGNDPEKDKSGIGLNNVKQRLQLLYPNKHELVIRETAKEFFVHLTIQLS